MRRGIGVLAACALIAACGSDDAGGTAGPSGSGGAGGNKDASSDVKNDAPADAGTDLSAPSCSDGKQNGAESDIDCGGSCTVGCATGKGCSAKQDCADKVCSAGTCQAATCSDGEQNGGEQSVDCGGPCPATYHGEGCTNGTNGSKVCTFFSAADAGVNEAGQPMFDVEISWNATGGNGKVNYVLEYGPGGSTYNSLGIVGGSAQNVCSSGPVTAKFQLPLGDQYTYKVWWADCIKSNACSGCGSDAVIAEGGPFGVDADKCI